MHAETAPTHIQLLQVAGLHAGVHCVHCIQAGSQLGLLHLHRWALAREARKSARTNASCDIPDTDTLLQELDGADAVHGLEHRSSRRGGTLLC